MPLEWLQIFWLMVQGSKLTTYLLKCGQKAEESLDILAGEQLQRSYSSVTCVRGQSLLEQATGQGDTFLIIITLFTPTTSSTSTSEVRHDPS